MAIGSIAPWADHEKKVCSRERATISSLVICPGAVLMPIVHLFGLAGRAARTGSRDRPLRRLGMASPGPRAPLNVRESTAPEPLPIAVLASPACELLEIERRRKEELIGPTETPVQ